MHTKWLSGRRKNPSTVLGKSERKIDMNKTVQSYQSSIFLSSLYNESNFCLHGFTYDSAMLGHTIFMTITRAHGSVNFC